MGFLFILCKGTAAWRGPVASHWFLEGPPRARVSFHVVLAVSLLPAPLYGPGALPRWASLRLWPSLSTVRPFDRSTDGLSIFVLKWFIL